jgi:glycosyltransferase involved in cell wall biosynthesis
MALDSSIRENNKEASGRKKVLIIAQFTDGAETGGNNRFNYLADLLGSEYDVELLTSSFFHAAKCQHKEVKKPGLPYQITYIYEPGYKKNVSMRRFYSHYIFGRSLKKYLHSTNKPDLIYCAVPSIDAGNAAANFSAAYHVPLVLDIQDLWPEAFKLVFRIPVISDMVFAPMTLRINRVYQNADEVVAVSDTYCRRALKHNKRDARGYSIFLGTSMKLFDQMANEHKKTDKPEDEFWIAYAGTLGHSYNLKIIIDALNILQNKRYPNIKLLVMGDGPLMKDFIDYAGQQRINAYFTGRLPYGDMVGRLAVSDIAVNPIQSGAAQSIINKHGDYAMAGLPVVSTQENPEYIQLLEQYEAGFTCDNSDAREIADKIEMLYLNKDLRLKMGENSRRMGKEKFDRDETYAPILHLIRQILTESV